MKYFLRRLNMQSLNYENQEIDEEQAIETIVDSIVDNYSDEGGELERIKEQISAMRLMITILAQACPDTPHIIQKLYEAARYDCPLLIEEDSDES